MRSQKEKRCREEVVDKLQTWASRIERPNYVGERNQPMKYVNYFYGTEGDMEKAEPPKDVKEVRYYYYVNESYIALYKEINMVVSSVDAEKERLREALEKREKDAEELHMHCWELRREWGAFGSNMHIDRDCLMRSLIQCMNEGMYARDVEVLGAVLNLDIREKSAYSREVDKNGFAKAIAEHTSLAALAVLMATLGPKCERPYETIWASNAREIKYRRSEKLCRLYDIMSICGYQISDTEKAYLDGTHEVYKKVRVEA